MLKADQLRCNHEKTPYGITGTPVFSWQLFSEQPDTIQEAYQLLICSSDKQIYDSGKISGSQSVEVEPKGFNAAAKEDYHWKVRIWDNHGQEAENTSYFEAAPGSFSAKWIEPSIPGVKYEKQIPLMKSMIFKVKPKLPPDERLLPVSLLRKEFEVKPGLAKARAYATAHGVYSIQFNGGAPDERLFAPEYTTYPKYLCYQTYDITKLLQSGKNACGVMLADGWWSGRIGIGGESGQYGMERAFFLQIELTYHDGTHETIVSDENFRCSANGTIRYSDIFIGEKQDHNYTQRIEEFSKADFNDHSWSPVVIADYGYDNLFPQIGGPVVKIKELKPVALLHTPKGETVIDFGQNFAGFVRLKVSAPKGTVIKLEHSEVLDEKGNFLNNIIGVNKDQTDIFICSGREDEVFEPQFTFHGFRYVKVTGMNTPELEDFCGIAISSKMDNLAEFECSNELMNKLYSNVRWSQYSNMISIPTDCPQRERAGWTADIQVFTPTASYSQDMNAFLTRWLESMEMEQLDDGQIPCVVPFSLSYQNSLKMQSKDSCCSAGWSEACIIVPYTLYQMYGNKNILSKHYPMMKKWIKYVQHQAEHFNPKSFKKKKNKTPLEIENHKYLWNTGWHYGDWMIPSISKGMMGGVKGAKITREITASIYYAYSAELMSRIAEIIGSKDDARKYHELNKRIKKAIADTYISEDGLINPDLQGSYVCALWYGVVPEDKVPKAVGRLKKLIEDNGCCLDTGFLATPILLDVLMKYGLKDIAYKILYQEKCPSWFYEIKKGATTIWESWDGIRPDGKVGNLSYNHYALGCVFDWIYRNIAGIQNQSAGYKKILIKPEPDETMAWARSSFKSVYGEIASSWKKENGFFRIQVKIPCNANATVIMPDGQQHEIGSGTYEFTCAM